MAMQEDNDTTGDVISVNGDATDVATAEDRGDVFEPELATVTEAVKSAPAETSDDAAEPAAITEQKQPQHIPKSRFDEVNNRKNELQQELAEAQRLIESMRAQQPTQPEQAAAPVLDLKTLRGQSREALMDGDLDKVAALDDLIDAELLRVAESRFVQRQAAQNEQNSLQSASVQAVADFPYLDTAEGQEALDLIIVARDAKIARGVEPIKALRDAVASIAPRFAPDGAVPPLGFDPNAKATDTRTAAALARGAADSNLQPASVQAGSGNRATAGRVNVAEMSEEQFENLSLAEKKRARGDL